MRVTVNGATREVAAEATVADTVAQVMAAAGVANWERGVAVAVNGEVVPRTQWTEVRLRGGDRVEVLTAAQGG